MPSFEIVGNVYREHAHVSTFDLMDGATHVQTARDADALLASYVVGLISQGGTATYSRVHHEYKIIMPDGATEYVRVPNGRD